jgi:hypothetical protein
MFSLNSKIGWCVFTDARVKANRLFLLLLQRQLQVRLLIEIQVAFLSIWKRGMLPLHPKLGWRVITDNVSIKANSLLVFR